MPRPSRLATAALVAGSAVLLTSGARTVLTAQVLGASAFPAFEPWLTAVAVFTLAVLALMGTLAGFGSPTRWPSRLLPAALAGSATAMFILVIPAGEGPDEFAHLQYTRYVAVTDALPTYVPPPDDPWRADSYEWVQQPTYYIATAAVGRLLGLAREPPQLRPDPASRLRGGTGVSIYTHAPETSRQNGIRLIWWLRLLHVGLAALTAWWLSIALRRAGAGPRFALAGSTCLGLVPQVSALMGYHSTDGAATAAAAMAVLPILRAAGPGASALTYLGAGAATGLALSIKLSTAYLMPMLALAVVWPGWREWRGLASRGAAAGVGVCLTGAWVPLREWWIFGDPLGRQFRAAILATAGLAPTPTPGLLDRAILEVWRVHVFESFWGRFGSLGAGPLPGSRLWMLYAAVTLLLAGACAAALLLALRHPRRHRGLSIVVTGAVTACALWVYVTLVPRPYMAIHWTPRYIQPALPVMAAVATLGLARTLAVVRVPDALLGPLAALGLAVMGAASLATLRVVVLQFLGAY